MRCGGVFDSLEKAGEIHEKLTFQTQDVNWSMMQQMTLNDSKSIGLATYKLDG